MTKGCINGLFGFTLNHKRQIGLFLCKKYQRHFVRSLCKLWEDACIPKDCYDFFYNCPCYSTFHVSVESLIDLILK